MAGVVHPVPDEYATRIGPAELDALYTQADADPDYFWLNQARRLH